MPQAHTWIARSATLLLLCLLCLVSACGGGGSSASGGCSTIDPDRNSSLPNCPSTSSGSMAMTLTNAAGAATSAVTSTGPGTLTVTLRTSANAPATSILVSFTSTDSSTGFIPASATALTDASGVARITLPAGTASGAFAATASATVEGKALSATVNYTATPSTSAGSLAVTLATSAGVATNAITAGSPGILTAVLRSSANLPVANALVTFTSTDKTVAFIPASATALTDSSGAARITLPIGSVAGAYTSTASVTVDGKALAASVNYTVTLPPVITPGTAGMTLQLSDASGAATTAITPARPGSLAATVRDASGAVAPNLVVSFSTTDSSGSFVPASGTALTNAQGVAQIALPAGSVEGAYTVTARTTVAGTSVSASTPYTVTIPAVATPAPTLALALLNPAGAATVNVTPDSPGTLRATLKDASGAVVPNAVVSFATNDKTGSLTPAVGSVLTNAQGVASVTLNAGSATGGFTATASASVSGSALAATANYAVSFPSLALGAPVISPSTLAAGGTANISVSVLNGSTPYAPALAVSFGSPCVTAGKARITTPVTTVNGVASTSYTDLGCATADTISASLAYNGATLSSGATINVLPVSAGQLAFVSALPQNIALKGTGGAGRQESATITFKVLDRSGNALAGQLVNFSLNTSAGGLSLSPASSTSNASGLVTTTVTAGTVNTPVRVSASVAGTSLTSLSDQLVVSTGVPEQNSFTLSSSILNVEGMDYAGCSAPQGSTITARLADHFHNPAPDGTAVSFTAEGGTIDASCLTGLTQTTLTDGTVITQKGTPGECTVRFCAANPRPADGRVTILAYALGEESFVDANGNNVYDNGESYTDLGEPFRNDRAVTSANANGVNDAWVASGNASRASGEPYIDSNGDGSWSAAGDGSYNGVLKAGSAVNTTPANTVHVRGALVQVLSSSNAAISLLNGPIALSHCSDGIAFSNTTMSYRIAIRDSNSTVFGANTLAGNPLPAGTTILFSTSNGTILGGASYTVSNTNNPDASGWIYTVQMASDATQAGTTCANTYTSGQLTVTVDTAGGVGASQRFKGKD